PQPTRSQLFSYTTLFRSKLLKPVFMINDLVKYNEFKNPFLTCLEFGASNPSLRALIDYGIPRETAINLISIKSPNFIEKDVLSLDRKSTRLNSSHVKISYAVFC